jgi:putative transposase
MPRLRHYDHLNTVRFVTFTCFHRQKLLTEEAVIAEFQDQVIQTFRARFIKIFAYVVMPEHVHLIVHPPDSVKLGPVIGELKSKAATRILSKKLIDLPAICYVIKKGVSRRAVWQPRCYDHNCRTRETMIEKINYCHNNPVKRRLVKESGDWRWSSFNWYRGLKDVPLTIDELEQ